MFIVMNPSSYEIEREVVAVEEYGDEVMCAGWNPQLALVGDRPVAKVDRHTELCGELVGMDVDDFLQKMYRYQG